MYNTDGTCCVQIELTVTSVHLTNTVKRKQLIKRYNELCEELAKYIGNKDPGAREFKIDDVTICRKIRDNHSKEDDD